MNCQGTHYCTVHHSSSAAFYVGVFKGKVGPVLDTVECCKSYNRNFPGHFEFYEIGTCNRISGIKGQVLENELKSNAVFHQGRYPITKIVV